MFVRRLVEQYKGTGYMIYFGILELMGSNFRPETPGVLRTNWTQIQYIFRVQRKTVKKVLKYIENEGKFRVYEEGDTIVITCPKFAELADRYAKRVLRERSESVDTLCPESGHFVSPDKKRIEEKEKSTLLSKRSGTDAEPVPDSGHLHSVGGILSKWWRR